MSLEANVILSFQDRDQMFYDVPLDVSSLPDNLADMEVEVLRQVLLRRGFVELHREGMRTCRYSMWHLTPKG